MWFIILRMLSGASLSAFTSSVQARAREVREVPPTPGIQAVRGQAETRPGNGVRIVPPQQMAPETDRQPEPDRTLPRGSLLDMSV